jgi:cell division protease FtsH
MGPLTFGKRDEQIFLGREIAKAQDYSEDTAIRIDQEVKKFVIDAYDRARDLLVANKPALMRIAEELLAREVLDAGQVKRLAQGLPIEDAPVPAAATPSDETPRRDTHERPATQIVPALGKPVGQE